VNDASLMEIMLPSFCLCLLMVGMLSYLGIHVIKREIIFVDLALAQIAALGALIGFLLGIPLHTQASYGFSLALTALAAAVFTLSRSRRSPVPQEAIIGLVYAIAAAVAIVLIDKAPHGAEHIKDVLTGSILWVKWQTVGTVAAVYAAVGLFHLIFHKLFLWITENPEEAEAQGVRVRLWDFLFYLTFGLVITVSVGSAGVLMVFVFLVAPAVMAVLLTDRLLYQVLFGWTLGFVATAGGLVLSYLGDLSSGPVVIGAYAVVLLLVGAVIHVVRASDRARALRQTLAVGGAFALCLAGLLLVGRAVGARMHGHGHHEHSAGVSAAADQQHPGETPAPAAEGAAAQEPAVTDLEAALAASDDPGEQADAVCQALDESLETGVELALQYLEGEPPPFFAQQVVDKLDSLLPQPTGFDVEQPFSAEVNQQAAARVRAAAATR